MYAPESLIKYFNKQKNNNNASEINFVSVTSMKSSVLISDFSSQFILTMMMEKEEIKKL